MVSCRVMVKVTFSFTVFITNSHKMMAYILKLFSLNFLWIGVWHIYPSGVVVGFELRINFYFLLFVFCLMMYDSKPKFHTKYTPWPILALYSKKGKIIESFIHVLNSTRFTFEYMYKKGSDYSDMTTSIFNI